MDSSFEVHIVSPTKVQEFKEVLAASFVSGRGSFGVLPYHADIIGELSSAGSLSLTLVENEVKEYALAGGFFEIRDNTLQIIADSFESPEEIDVIRAQEAKRRAESELKKKGIDTVKVEAALLRAINRLKVAGKGGI